MLYPILLGLKRLACFLFLFHADVFSITPCCKNTLEVMGLQYVTMAAMFLSRFIIMKKLWHSVGILFSDPNQKAAVLCNLVFVPDILLVLVNHKPLKKMTYCMLMMLI